MRARVTQVCIGSMPMKLFPPLACLLTAHDTALIPFIASVFSGQGVEYCCDTCDGSCTCSVTTNGVDCVLHACIIACVFTRYSMEKKKRGREGNDARWRQLQSARAPVGCRHRAPSLHRSLRSIPTKPNQPHPPHAIDAMRFGL